MKNLKICTALNNYLSSKFSFKNSSTLKCNFCNNFIGTNLKSIAAHKRKLNLKIKNKYYYR